MRGCRADVLDVASAAALDVAPTYAAAFVGGSVHQHRHQDALLHFVKHNHEVLAAMPVAMFSVSLAAAQTDLDSRLDAQHLADRFVDEANLSPLRVCCVAGALKYTQYDYFKRLAMHWIARHTGGDTDTSKDHEYTDWKDVEAFVDEFLAAARLGAGQAVAEAG